MLLDRRRWRPPVPIAHRGSRLLWPENTLLAFQNVYDLGFRHFETDVHMTKDGEVVVIHDPTVDRTTNGSGFVSDLTLAEIKDLDAGYRHRVDGSYPFRRMGVEVPTLSELLTAFVDASMVIDMKADGLIGELAGVIERRDAHDRLIVGSFCDQRCAEFARATGGTVPTSTGTEAVCRWVVSSRAGCCVRTHAAALQVPTQVLGVTVADKKLVAAAHKAGLQVHVWTVNQPEEMIRLLDLGVDGLITDRPDLLKKILSDRGQWSVT